MADTNFFDQFTSIDNLRKAWIKAKDYASTEHIFYDEFAFNEFTEHIDAKLLSLAFDLNQETYTPKPLRFVSIPKGDKQRKVYFSSPRDTVVMQAILNVIGPIFENLFSPMSFGNRLNVGHDESKETYHRWQDQYTNYVSTIRGFWNSGPDAWYVITDIENFYPTVSLDWLMGLIDTQISDKRISVLIYKMLHTKAIDASGTLEDIPGLPPGTIYSHFFANIYLNEFDHIAITQSIRYARYVDDICFLCKDKVSLENLKKALGDYLGRWNQGFKVSKTIEKQNSDSEPLIEHTRRMKYANRLDVFETLDVDSQVINSIKSIEKPFYRLYKIAEKEGNLSNLVEEAGLIISYLRKVNPDNLREIIISLIDLHPLKPSTLKAAICSLLEIENQEKTETLWNLVFKKVQEDHYFTLIFLQLIGYYDLDPQKLLDYLLACCDSPNYLIRATAYFEIWKFLDSQKGEIDLCVINNRIANEHDGYVKSRIIYCYSGTKSNVGGLLVFPLVDPQNTEILFPSVRSIHNLIKHEQIEPNNFLTVWAKLQNIPRFGINLFIEIVFLASRYQLLWIVESLLTKSPYQNSDQLFKVLETISLELVGEFSQDKNYVSLYQYADFLSNLGLKIQANIGYEEIKSGTSDGALREQIQDLQIKSPVIDPNIDLPAWARNQECNRYTYRHQKGDTGYLCRYYKDELGHSGILEIITNERVVSSGFSNITEWNDYLSNLNNQGIIPSVLVSTDETRFPESYYFYEIPEGFLSLTDLFNHRNVDGLLSKNIVFKIGACLANLIRSAQHGNFVINSFDPLSIFWNPTDEKILILNVGASLGISKYQCGISGCTYDDSDTEIGITSASYHLGMLLLQMLKKDCPICLINSTKSRYGNKRTIYDVFSDIELLPHHRHILGRLLQPDSNLRYSNNLWLEKDLFYANTLLEYITRITSDKSDTDVSALTLIDFVVFRLRIIARNPNLLEQSPIARSQKTVEELADSLRYLPAKILENWPILLDQKPENNIFPPANKLRDISPEGRRLLEISQGWEKLTKDHKDHKLPTALFTFICLYQVLSIEVQSTLVACIEIACAKDRDLLVNSAEKIINTIFAQFSGDEALELDLHSKFFQTGVVHVEITKEQLGLLNRFVEEIKNHSDDNHLPKLDSLTTFSLIYTFFGLPIEISHKNNQICKTTPILNSGKKIATSKDIWSFLFEFPQLDKKIQNLQIINNEEYSADDARQNTTNILEHFPVLIRVIRSLNPASRVSAEIYSYQPRNFYFESDGLAEVVSIIPKTIAFDTSRVFVSGHPSLGEKGKRRPIKLDVIKTNGNPMVATSILAPIGRFNELPFNKSKLTPYQISVWSRKLPLLAAIIIGVIALAFSLILLTVFNLMIGKLLSPMAQGIISFVIVVVNILFKKFYDGLIATLKPEDSDENKK